MEHQDFMKEALILAEISEVKAKFPLVRLSFVMAKSSEQAETDVKLKKMHFAMQKLRQ